MQGGDSNGKSMSPKTPQNVFLEEAEAMPVESVHLKLQLSNHQATRFDKEPKKAVHLNNLFFQLLYYSNSAMIFAAIR